MRLYIDPADGETFERWFDGQPLVVGRSSTSDLALADPFLSRYHARIFQEGDRVLIEDLGSRNGTFVNGTAVRTATAIAPGDVIKVSGSVISVCDENHPPPASDTASDLGATIFRPAQELLAEDSQTHPDSVEGEAALRKYAERLKLFNEIHEALGRSIELDKLLELILDRAFDHLRPEQGVIFLRGAEGQGFYRAATHSVSGQKEELPLSKALIEEVCAKGMAALVLDAETDERFSDAQSIIMHGVRSLVAAPLLDEQSSLGMIVLSSKAGVRQFSEGDLEFLVSMASIAALKIRNAALAEEAVQRKRLEEELALARRIQLSLLPSALPKVEGYSLYARNTPSRGVSGDYFQIQSRRDGAEALCLIVDVSGKGVPAALLTTAIDALAAVPIADGATPEQICTHLSRHLLERSPPEKYATLFLGALETETGKVRYTNAGHNPSFLLQHGGGVIELAANGMPVGLVEGARYSLGEIQMDAADTLVLYTDGITEAENPDEEQYGLERLVAVCHQHRAEPLTDLAKAIHRDLDHFTQGVPYADDRTLLMIRRL